MQQAMTGWVTGAPYVHNRAKVVKSGFAIAGKSSKLDNTIMECVPHTEPLTKN